MVTAMACARQHAPLPERTELDLLQNDPTNTFSASASSVRASIEEASMGACEKLQQLKDSREGPTQATFSLFGEIKDTEEFNARIDVESSPFTQLFLADFKLMSPAAFFEEAKKEYKAGRLSEFKWQILRMASNSPWALRSLQISATNEKIAKAFPGIFGSSGPLNESLYHQLIQKHLRRAPLLASEMEEAMPILTARVPLFMPVWSQVAEDVRESLSAALTSLNEATSSREGKLERLCGTVLWQRSFAQLLALKGYYSLRTIQSNGKAAFPEISESGSQKVEVGGAFFNRERRVNVALAQETIANYEPADGAFDVAYIPPQGLRGSPVRRSGGLEAQADLLETLVAFYEASSPASAPNMTGIYPLGDIKDPTNDAIVPHEAHQLTLGLLNMSLKNLKHSHIVEINDDAKIRSKDEKATGIALVGSAGHESGTTHIPLRTVLSLVRSVTYLDHALDQFKIAPPEHWAAKSPIYKKEILARLLGSELFSKTELAEYLTEETPILKNSLRRLLYPLAMLLLQYSDDQGNCRTELKWNLKTGQRKTENACSAQQVDLYRKSLTLLGNHGPAPVLLKRAARL